MTLHEKTMMAKIQINQLTTENKFLDDYYCQAFEERNESAKECSSALPRFAPRKPSGKTHRRPSISLESALGKFSVASVRVPRKAPKMITKEADVSLKAGTAMHLRVLNKIESLYLYVLNVEEEVKKQYLEQSYSEEAIDLNKKLLVEQLNLKERALSREELMEMIQFLNFEKGKKVIKRICRHLNKQEQYILFVKIISALEYIDVTNPSSCKSLASPSVNNFINYAISPFVECLEDIPEAELVNLISNCLFSKKRYSYIASSKVGLVILCVLLNALENARRGAELTQLSLECGQDIFEGLEGCFAELFSSSSSSSDEEMDIYAWQFLAFLACTIREEAKKALVTELREKIMQIVNFGSKEKVKNLNVFLNALGLDVSQIKPT